MFSFINIKTAADNVIKRPTELTEPITAHMQGQCKMHFHVSVCVCSWCVYICIYSFIFHVSVVSLLRFLCQNNELNPYLKRREPLSHTNSINAVYTVFVYLFSTMSVREWGLYVNVYAHTHTHAHVFVCTLQSSLTLSSTLSHGLQ